MPTKPIKVAPKGYTTPKLETPEEKIRHFLDNAWSWTCLNAREGGATLESANEATKVDYLHAVATNEPEYKELFHSTSEFVKAAQKYLRGPRVQYESASTTEAASSDFLVYFSYTDDQGNSISSGRKVKAQNPKDARDRLVESFKGRNMSIRKVVTADYGPATPKRETSEREQIKIAQYFMKKMQMGQLKRMNNTILGIGIAGLPPGKLVQEKLEWLGWKLADNKMGVMRFEKQGVPFHLSYYFQQNFLAAPRYCDA